MTGVQTCALPILFLKTLVLRKSIVKRGEERSQGRAEQSRREEKRGEETGVETEAVCVGKWDWRPHPPQGDTETPFSRGPRSAQLTVPL